MKTKTFFIALSLSAGILVSCADKKEAKENTSTEKTEVKTEVKTEIKEKEIKSESEKEAERRLDSIRQVKEHGHAH